MLDANRFVDEVGLSWFDTENGFVAFFSVFSDANGFVDAGAEKGFEGLGVSSSLNGFVEDVCSLVAEENGFDADFSILSGLPKGFKLDAEASFEPNEFLFDGEVCTGCFVGSGEELLPKGFVFETEAAPKGLVEVSFTEGRLEDSAEKGLFGCAGGESEVSGAKGLLGCVVVEFENWFVAAMLGKSAVFGVAFIANGFDSE